MSMFKPSWFVPILLLASQVLHAQANATISGNVLDPSGAAIAGASVNVRNTGTALTRSATSDAQGHYQIQDLPIGDYEIEGKHAGFQTLVDAGYDPLDYRYFLLGGHYRSQLQFSYEALDSAKASRKSLVDRIIALDEKAGPRDAASVALGPKASSYIEAFTGHLCQDLATPRALAELWGLLRDNDIPPAEALAAAYKMDEVLGLSLAESRKPEAAAVDPGLAAEIEALVAERAAAKKAKDWARADAVRAQLKSKGVLLEDGPAGTAWKLG